MLIGEDCTPDNNYDYDHWRIYDRVIQFNV